MTSDSDSGQSRPSLAWAALLPVVYVLSLGPVAWMLEHFGVPWSSWVFGIAIWLYMPLDWLAEASPLFRSLIEWYVDLYTK